MEKKTYNIISEQELKKLLKMKMRFTASCCDCPINDLTVRNGMSCIRIIQLISGKTPTSCGNSIIILRDFLKKFKQNKI